MGFCGQHQERLLQFEGLIADGDLLLLHGFEQGALHFGRGAIDFVGQDQVGENGAAPGSKGPRLRIVNLRADQVGREQVRGELETGEFNVDGGGQGLDREGLGQTRHTFQQNVPIAEKADDEAFDQVILANNHFADLAEERAHKSSRLLHLFINCANACIHNQ